MIPHQPRLPAGPSRAGGVPDPGRGSASPDLVRVTVNLSPRTEAALGRLVQGWGVNKTDAVNRAVRLADLLQEYTVDERLVVQTNGREVEVRLI